MPLSPSRRRSVASLTALFVALGGLLLIAPVAQAVPTYAVSGTITLDGGPLPGGTFVEVDKPDGDPVGSKTVDDLGDYQIGGLAPGSYTLIVSPSDDDHSAYSGSLSITSANVTRDVTLKKNFTCSTQISGAYRVGQTLSAVNTLSPTEPAAVDNQTWYRYQLDPDGDPDYGSADFVSEAGSYTLTDADLGFRFGYVADVQGDQRSGFCSTDDGPQSPIVGRRLAALQGAPAISGKAKVGKTLTATAPTSTGAAARYQWFRVTKKSKHQRSVTKAVGSGPTYKVKRKDKGAKLFVRVIASGGGYATGSADSARVKVRR